MIRNVDINFFKNQKIKLCAIGVGIIIGMGLTGCTNVNNQELNTNTSSSAEEIIICLTDQSLSKAAPQT